MWTWPLTPLKLPLKKRGGKIINITSSSIKQPIPNLILSNVYRMGLLGLGSAPVVFNAANEVAVERFLAGGIGFLAIAETVEETLSRIPNTPLNALDDVHGFDAEARRIAVAIADQIVAVEYRTIAVDVARRTHRSPGLVV